MLEDEFNRGNTGVNGGDGKLGGCGSFSHVSQKRREESHDLRWLGILSGGLRWGEDLHAGGVEDEGFDFGFGALGGEFLAIPDKGHARSIAYL